jgi:hypothetical protein
MNTRTKRYRIYTVAGKFFFATDLPTVAKVFRTMHGYVIVEARYRPKRFRPETPT